MIIMMSERLLRRALGYLRLSGLDIDTAVERSVLDIVSQVIAEEASRGEPIDETTAFERLMAQLETVFTLPEPSLPPVTPVMERGSIGYGDVA